ncbi:MAG TPA: arginase family protein, partial [Methanoregulaceae archaeon]|nr:arginase family protein [Methanoregulaceae archaeon]
WLTDEEIVWPKWEAACRAIDAFVEPIDALQISVCLDAFPAAAAPGVSAPAARGIAPDLALSLLGHLLGRLVQLHRRGVDLSLRLRRWRLHRQPLPGRHLQHPARLDVPQPDHDSANEYSSPFQRRTMVIQESKYGNDQQEKGKGRTDVGNFVIKGSEFPVKPADSAGHMHEKGERKEQFESRRKPHLHG